MYGPIGMGPFPPPHPTAETLALKFSREVTVLTYAKYKLFRTC
jgi:hypothetical protein